jgi:hypothetical protein
MNKINYVRLMNFRGFRDSGQVRLAPLTFLVGPNSSGKSSLADGALLVSQSIEDSTYWTTPDWMGRLVDLGSYKDAVYKHAPQRPIAIELGVAVDPTGPRLSETTSSVKRLPQIVFQWNLRSDPTSGSGELHSMCAIDALSGIQIRLINLTNEIAVEIDGHRSKLQKSTVGFSSTGYYVYRIVERFIKENRAAPGTKSAYWRIAAAFGSYAYQHFFVGMERVSSARSGPKRWVAKGAMQNTESKFRGLLDDPYTMTLEPPTSTRTRLRRRGQATDTVAKYLSELGIASAIRRQDLSAYHGALNVTDSVSNVTSNLADVGFGASQVIPVIRGCLSDSTCPLFLEQPEIHLHPRAQGQLANLICATSKRRQVIVETHSEHMINRARILIAEGSLSANDVSIIYVDRRKTGSHTTEIGIDASGDFTAEWPSGFFDERYQDSMRLIELKSHSGPVVDLPRPARSKRVPQESKKRGE